MKTVLIVLVLALLSAALGAKPKTRFSRYRSWNAGMYPVWKDGDSRYRDCWTGGEVTFNVKNDAPTLTGAKATFNIDLQFPSNQTVLPDGQVVWARNCTVNGTQYRQGQAVYPDQVSGPSGEYRGVFPDGTPFTGTTDRKPHYVFVWKTWGRYWQVADGTSSSLTIGTDNVPLGSYNMEVVIYHCRGKDKFIPLGYASTTFSITDQIPFAVSLTQINDVNEADQSFIQNRAIAFSISLHDPSQYLSASDVTFNWDFGDNSGTLISREHQVTHTYLTTGTYRPQVVLMASIPNGCDTPADPTAASPTVMPMDPSGAPAVVVVVSTPRAAPADIALDVPASDVAPAEAADTAAADADAADTDAATATAEDPAAAETAVEAGATAEDAAPDVSTAEAEPTADDAATAAEGVEVVSSAADDPVVIPATEDPAAVPAVEADATAEDTAAAAIEDPTAVPAVEGATAAPVAPATEEAAAVDADAAAAAETAVVEATAADVPAIDAAASVAPVAEGEEATVDLVATVLPEVPAVATVTPVEEAAVVADAEVVAEVAAAAEVAQAETVAPAANVIVPAATEAAAVVEVVPAEPALEEEAELEAELEAEVVETVIEVAADATAAPAAVTAPVDSEVAAEAEIEADIETQVTLVVAKRQAPELTAADNCMIYRYGSFSTAVDVVQGIESVEITQVANVVSLATEVVQNAVDLTITCQGSLPNEVCTIISDADCITPVETICNNVTPSPDCQMILRQFFNDSGVFCINVSLTNDVSLAVASAKVSVTVGSNSSPAGTVAAVLGVMVLVCVVGAIALTYKRFNQYRPLREDSTGGSMGSSGNTSVPMLLWNLLSRQSPGERSPLLQGRVV